MSTKEKTAENVSKSIVESEMVAQQNQPPKPIKAENTEGPSKLQIAPNPKWNPSSEMRQNNIVVIIPNKVWYINKTLDLMSYHYSQLLLMTNQSVSDEKDPSTI